MRQQTNRKQTKTLLCVGEILCVGRNGEIKMKYKLELTENQIEELKINVEARLCELTDLVAEAEDDVKRFTDDTYLSEQTKGTLKMKRNEQRAMKQVLNKINKYYK